LADEERRGLEQEDKDDLIFIFLLAVVKEEEEEGRLKSKEDFSTFVLNGLVFEFCFEPSNTGIT
jgi:hypothetical protein